MAVVSMDIDQRSIFVNFPGDMLQAFPVAVDYCKRILFLAALPSFKIEPGWERQLEALVQSDMTSRETIRAYLHDDQEREQALLSLLTAAFEGMLQEQVSVAEQCARTFTALVSFAPKSLLGSLATRSQELLPLVTSNKKEVRSLAARAYGILAAHPGNSAQAIQGSKAALAGITSKR